MGMGRSRGSTWLACVCGLGLAAIPGLASAADIYVDAGAGGGGDGSAGAPFADLQDGIDAAAPGDFVHVAAGTYNGEFQTNTAGAEGARITVVADAPGEVVLQGSGRVLDVAHPYHTFDGLVIDGGYGGSDTIRGDGGDYVEYLGIEVRRSSGDCIDLRNATGVLIENASIHHCVASDGGSQSDAHGVTGDSLFDLTIRDTEIYLVTGDSVQVSPPREPWDNVIISGCSFWSGALDEDGGGLSQGTLIGENAIDTKVGDDLNGAGSNPYLEITDTIAYGWRGALSNQAAFNIKEEVNAVIDRVTVYDSEIAFRLRGPAMVSVSNAVIYDVDKAARFEDGIADARLLASTIGADIAVEMLENGGGGDPVGLTIENLLVLGDAVPPLAMGAANLAVDASVFVDVPAGDYRLQPMSAPVNAGVDLAEVGVDRDGVPRPVGDAHDVGAHEWTDMPPGDDDDDDDDDDDGDDDDDDMADGGDAGEEEGGGDGPGDDDDDDVADDGAGSEGGSDGGDASGDGDGGCGCRSTPRPIPLPWQALLVVLPAIRRRR